MESTFVDAYSTATGQPQRIPRAWLTHPVFSEQFTTIPPSIEPPVDPDPPVDPIPTPPAIEPAVMSDPQPTISVDAPGPDNTDDSTGSPDKATQAKHERK